MKIVDVDRAVQVFVSCPVMQKLPRMVRLIPLILAMAVATLYAVMALGLHRTGLRVPAGHDGDSLMMLQWIDSMARGEGWMGDRRLGLPGTQDLSDFPRADYLHLAGLQFLCRFSSDPAVVMNLALVIDFPLIVLSAHAAFRWLGIGPWISAALATLFACLPYHLGQVNHLFLVGYFLVPWQLIPAIGLARSVDTKSAESNPVRWWDPVVAFAGGLAGLYYAWFASFLVMAAAIRSGVCRKSWAPVLTGLALAGAAGLGCASGYLPTMFRQDGPNPMVGARLALESEVYALKPLNLVLPFEGHGSGLGIIRHEFNGPHRPLHEAETYYMGASASAGAVLGLMAVITGRRGGLIESAGFLVLMLLALAVPGGLGALVAYVLPGVRALGRAGLPIAFLGLAISGFALDSGMVGRSGVKVAMALFMVALGLADQRCKPEAADPSTRSRDWESLRAFGAEINHRAGADARHFQLPHLGYPEAIAPGSMGSYDHLAAVLHVRDGRFSFGGMTNRPAEVWCRWAASLPPRKLVALLAEDGWKGLWIDLRGMPNPVETRREFEALLGAPLEGPGGNRLWFPIRPVAGETAPQAPLLARLAEGFPMEAPGNPSRVTARCRERVRIQVDNLGPPRGAVINIVAERGYGPPGGIRLTGLNGKLEESLSFNGSRLEVKIPAEFPQGTSEFELVPMHPVRIHAPLPLGRFAAWVELTP